MKPISQSAYPTTKVIGYLRTAAWAYASCEKTPPRLDGVKFGRAVRDHKRAAEPIMPRFGDAWGR
jgi:hypothetical protein